MNEHYDPFNEEEQHSEPEENTDREINTTEDNKIDNGADETPAQDPFELSEEEAPLISHDKKHRPLSPYVVAGFWQRSVAFVIDTIIASGFSTIFTSPVIAMMGRSDGLAVAAVKGFFFLLYFVLSTKITNGQTLGKMILGLRVIHREEEKLSWTTVIVREGFGRFVQNKIMFIYIVTAFTSEKQHLVDMLCDTYVVKEDIYALEQHAPDLFFQYS